MRYYKTADASIATIAEIRAALPHVSIPAGADLSEFGYEFLVETTAPAADPGHVVVEGDPELIAGEWVTTWVQQAKAPEAIMVEIVSSTQARLDAFAQTRNYDGILSACTYATSTVTKFQEEAEYCVNARDATWSTLYGILEEVQTEVRGMPTGYAAIEAELPTLTWPE